MMVLISRNFTSLCKSSTKILKSRLPAMKHFLEKCLLQEWIGYHYRIIYMNFWYDIIMIHTIGISYQLLNCQVIYQQTILVNQSLYYQMWINLVVFGSLPRSLDLVLHPDIKEVHTSWPNLYKMMKPSIFTLVKCNIISNIQFSFQPVPKHIDLLLLNGICGLQMSE